jgi:transcriptional regulator with XRE-family HTH domain
LNHVCDKRRTFLSDMRADHISTVFGQVLREHRTARGISQENLALSADVDRTFVSQMERGIRQPTITTLIKLSGALGVQPSTLVARMERLLR